MNNLNGSTPAFDTVEPEWDAEMSALMHMVDFMNDAEEAERTRVMDYLVNRFFPGIQIVHLPKTVVET